MKIVIALVLFLVIGFVGGICFIINILGAKTVYYRQLANKHFKIMHVFDQWLEMLEKGGSIARYFEQNNYRTIAIYGMGYLGKRLLKELDGTGIEVKYLLDQQLSSMHGEIPVFSINEVLKPVDVIVVTPVCSFYSIRKRLREKTNDKVIFIEDIIRWNLCDVEKGASCIIQI